MLTFNSRDILCSFLYMVLAVSSIVFVSNSLNLPDFQMSQFDSQSRVISQMTWICSTSYKPHMST